MKPIKMRTPGGHVILELTDPKSVGAPADCSAVYKLLAEGQAALPKLQKDFEVV